MQIEGSDRRPMAEINITPMVDVMLVLLVIFMVTAPLMHQGIDVNLPQAKGKQLPPEERLTVIIKKDGDIHLNKKLVSQAELRLKLESMRDKKPSVFLRADKDVPYGLVVQVMSSVKEAGVDKLGMITEPRITDVKAR